MYGTEEYEMKTFMYITSNDLTLASDGVKKKIDAQINVFDKLGFSTTVSGTNGEKAVIIEKGKNIARQKYGTLLPRRMATAINVLKYLKKKPKDIVYVRFSQFTILTIWYFRIIKKYTKYLVLEVPTYPYPLFKGYKRFAFLSESMAADFLKGCIDRVIYVGTKTERLFGAKAVQIPNGMPDIESMAHRKVVKHDDLRLISVSTMFPHHGYERLIMALADYYKNEKKSLDIKFIMVGEGAEYRKYKKMIDEYGLEKYVILKGKMSGRELEKEYYLADIGVAPLAIDGIEEVSTLKVKEYFRFGLPFIYVVPEIGLPEKYLYAYKLSCGRNGKIDMGEIVDFANRLKKIEAKEVEEEMQEFARNVYSWEKIMKQCLGDIIDAV